MKISIKDLGIDMYVKRRGIEFEVRDPAGHHMGDLILSSSGLEWCAGRVRRGNGVKVPWLRFIEWIQQA